MASVKQKVAAIEKKCGEVRAAVNKIHGAIREQEKVNAAAAREIESGVRKLQGSIKEQANTNKAYIRDFYFGGGKE